MIFAKHRATPQDTGIVRPPPASLQNVMSARANVFRLSQYLKPANNVAAGQLLRREIGGVWTGAPWSRQTVALSAPKPVARSTARRHSSNAGEALSAESQSRAAVTPAA